MSHVNNWRYDIFGFKLDLQLTYISLLGSWMFMVDVLNLFMGGYKQAYKIL